MVALKGGPIFLQHLSYRCQGSVEYPLDRAFLTLGSSAMAGGFRMRVMATLMEQIATTFVGTSDDIDHSPVTT